MSDKKYKNIVDHYENCLNQYGDNHKGVDWPNKDDVIKRYKVMLEVIPNEMLNQNITLLDFGCGAGHLYEYILQNQSYRSFVNYSGSDLSQKFIDLSEQKFPNNKFYCFDILEVDINTIPTFDYIVFNGVFTEKRDLSFDEMWAYFQKMIRSIYPLVNKGFAFNIMSKAVDWERDDLFHLSADKLISFLTKEISRNFIIRNDYGLYEYTVYVYK